MPAVAGFETLPPELRAWLIHTWRRTGYGQNAEVAAELNVRLRSYWRQTEADGSPPQYDASTVYRWARHQRNRTAQIQYAAELRAATIAALPDPDPDLAARAGAYMEGRLIEAIEDLDAIGELDPATRMTALTQAASAITARRRVETQQAQADLARAKWDAEQAIRAEERTKAADQAEGAARGQGVSPEGIAALRAAIMGAL